MVTSIGRTSYFPENSKHNSLATPFYKTLKLLQTMSAIRSPTYEDLLNIFARAEPLTRDAGRISVDSEELPSYQDMMNIFADVDEVETVPNGTQARAEAKATCQPIEQDGCVELQSAIAHKKLPQAFRRCVSDKRFCGQSTLEESKPHESMSCDREDQDELPTYENMLCIFEGKDRDRLPSYENMLCIFNDLDMKDTGYTQNRNQQEENMLVKAELKSLKGMNKFGHDCAILPGGGQTPSSVITIGLVCK